MITKTFNITLNKQSNSTVKYSDIVLVSGDTKVYTFNIQMLDGESNLDLSSVDHAWIIFKKSDGNVVQGDLVISDAVNGQLTYEVGTQEIAKEGTVYAEVELYGSDSEQLTSNRFSFNVRGELSTPEQVISSTQYNVLTTITDTVNAAETTRESNEDIRKAQEASRVSAETDRVNAELLREQHMKVIPKENVPTYTDISITYPNPEIGWLVNTIDTNKWWRYDGSTWVNVATYSSDALNALIAEMDTESRSLPQTNTASIFSMPPSTKEGQVKGDVEGDTRENLVKSSNMDTDTDGDDLVDDFTKTVHTGSVTANVTLDAVKKAQKVDITASTGAGNVDIKQVIDNITSNETVSISVDIETANFVGGGDAGFHVQVHANWLDESNAILGYTELAKVTTDTLSTTVKLENQVTPTNTTKAELYLRAHVSNAGETGTAWFKNALVEKATTVGNYIESGIKHTPPFALISCGENKFNKSATPYMYIPSSDDVTVIETNAGIRVKALTDGTYRRVKYKLKLKPNTQHKIQRDLNIISGATNSSAAQIYITDSNDNSVDSPFIAKNGTSTIFTSPDDGIVFIYFYATHATSESGDVEFSNLVIQEGTTAEYIEHDFSTTFIHPSEPLRKVGGVADKVGLETGEVDRNNNECALKDENIISVGDLTNVQRVTIELPDDVITPTSDYRGRVKVDGISNEVGYPYDVAGNENSFYSALDLGTRLVYLLFAKGTYPDIAAARTALAGKKVAYQKQTPTTEPDAVDGTLSSYKKGTVYIYPWIKENPIATGETIAISEENEDYPIESLVSLEIKDPNTSEVTKLNISDCDIADDGKSFSHSSIVKNYLVNFVYAYNSALLAIPTTNFTYPLNTNAMLHDNIEMTQKNTEKTEKNEDRIEVLEGEVITAEYTEELGNETSVFSTGTGINESGVNRGYNAKVVDGEVVFGLSGRTDTNLLDNSVNISFASMYLSDWERIGNTIKLNACNNTGGWHYINVHSVEDIIKNNTTYTLLLDITSNMDLLASTITLQTGDAMTKTSVSYVIDIAQGTHVYKIKINTNDNLLTNQIIYWSVTPYYLVENVGLELTLNNKMLIEGDYENKELHYITGIQSTTPQRIESLGKNLFDGELESGGYSSTTGIKLVDGTAIRSKNFIRLKPNTDHVASIDGTATSIALYFFDKNTNFVSFLYAPTGIFTTPDNISYATFYKGAFTNLNSNIQLEKGDKATAYEPFKHSYVDFDFELHEVPDGTRDRVYKADDGEYYKDWQNDNHVLQSGDITAYTPGANVDLIGIVRLSDMYAQTAGLTPEKMIIPNFSVCPSWTAWDDVSYEYQYIDSLSFSAGINLIVPKGTYANLAEAQANLAGKEIIYKLATPVQVRRDITQLTGYSNGQISITPYINREHKYHTTNKIKLDYAVSDIDKVTDIESNEYEWSLDADSKTLTVTGGVQDAYYRVQAPIKSELSTVPTSKHRARLNRLVDQKQIDEMNKDAQTMQEQLDLMALQILQLMGV